MSDRERDALYLVHINECIARIKDYTRDGRSAFFGSSLIQDGVLRNLQTLAELSQRLSGSLKNAHPEVDWRKMAGFRNVPVHDYLGIDLDIVWLVVAGDLTPLEAAVRMMLQEKGLD